MVDFDPHSKSLEQAAYLVAKHEILGDDGHIGIFQKKTINQIRNRQSEKLKAIKAQVGAASLVKEARSLIESRKVTSSKVKDFLKSCERYKSSIEPSSESTLGQKEKIEMGKNNLNETRETLMEQMGQAFARTEELEKMEQSANALKDSAALFVSETQGIKEKNLARLREGIEDFSKITPKKLCTILASENMGDIIRMLGNREQSLLVDLIKDKLPQARVKKEITNGVKNFLSSNDFGGILSNKAVHDGIFLKAKDHGREIIEDYVKQNREVLIQILENSTKT
jgi:hypothetical protein